jgi:hypothetical protein
LHAQSQTTQRSEVDNIKTDAATLLYLLAKEIYFNQSPASQQYKLLSSHIIKFRTNLNILQHGQAKHLLRQGRQLRLCSASDLFLRPAICDELYMRQEGY